MRSTAVSGKMPILKSTGSGRTTLAAFHRALVALDLGHYNLVRLSSVMPPGTVIDETGSVPAPSGDWGDRLYCVFAEQRTSTPGEEAWAGMGWIHRLDDAGGGLLVEHEGGSEAFVADAITASLRDMAGSMDKEFSAPNYVLSGAKCLGEPVCALVIAPFEVTSWELSR